MSNRFSLDYEVVHFLLFRTIGINKRAGDHRAGDILNKPPR